MPKTYDSGKRCLVYCGDDNCDCECSPHHPRNMLPLEGEQMYFDEAAKNAQRLDGEAEALERFNEAYSAQLVEEARCQRESVQDAQDSQ